MIKKILLSFLFAAGICLTNANATTWYVRDGGGDASQCTGQTNAIYPGSGTNQPCAFSHPRYALGWGCGGGGHACVNQGVMKSGDTLSISGDSDLTPGAQAQYKIGYDDTGSGQTPGCSPSGSYDCTLGNIPAGTSTSARTTVIGTGTHKPQLWGTQRVWQVLNADNNHIALQWLEITDHAACEYNGPGQAGCNYSGPYPYGPWAEDGIYLGGDDVNLTDVYEHGVGRFGMYSDNFGSANFTRAYFIGNGYAGVSTGTAATISGTLTWKQPIIDWNGCVEAYPITDIENPSNYSNCFGQNSNGYGDGLAFGNSGHGNAGNWTIIGPGSISFNTQDGLDTLHGVGNGTIQIDKMRFEGNAGQQVKINALNANLTNSLIIADCGWWYQAPQSYSGFRLGDVCRANGDGILFNVTNGSTANIFNNTLLSNGSIAIESEDVSNTGCNASTAVNFKNNIVYGGYWWGDDSSFNGSGQNRLTTYRYNDGNDGNGSGTCGQIPWNEDYNIVYNTNNNNQGCSGPHDKCGSDPQFVSLIPMGSAGGAESSFYQGNQASTSILLSGSSPAIGSAVSGLSYWNNGNDYHNVSRPAAPADGAMENNSCAGNATGCFFNSDCCGSNCTNLTCGGGGASPSPKVAITAPANNSTFTSGSNVTITVTASETNGTIKSISLYNGVGVLLGSGTSSPYTYTATAVVAGSYTLIAQATDGNGVSATSSPVNVTVTSGGQPSLPVVSMTTPANGSTITAGSNITATATATETNGTIKSISLYNGTGVLLGTGTTSPYSFVDQRVPAGQVTYSAQAVDNNGVSATSAPVTVTVKGALTPTVAITSPANNSTYTTGSSVTITVSASETGGSISNIKLYYNGTNLLGSSTTSPYSITASGVPAGTYTLTATATDASGATATSSPVTVIVGAQPMPVVAITSPANNATLPAGSNMAVTASASETNGSISKVMFYNGTTLLGSVTTSPYTYNWTNVPAGSYTLTAVAYDASNRTTTSSPVAVTAVNPRPVVSITSPANNSNFAPGANITITAAASESGGTITGIKLYYNGANLIGSSGTSPYSITATGVPAGTYTLTATATDTRGATVTSTPVTVNVAQPSPVVSISFPSNNSTLPSGSNVTIAASASETNGTISKVDFYYNGTNLLATVTAPPYSVTAYSVPAGTFTLTAKATDSRGVAVTSSPVTVTFV